MGEKDDYDSENSWIAEGLPSSSHRLFSLSVGKGHELGEGVANGLLRVSALYVKKNQTTAQRRNSSSHLRSRPTCPGLPRGRTDMMARAIGITRDSRVEDLPDRIHTVW